ncbi:MULTISPECIES: DUF3482 domain-containing protein [unclassified Methylophaga]|jgi:hypothetical protein|uniref:DUF3482 domain-containing protein n=1 Tax=unclassified Methylophaga TaxID=2629249 RepID=UPI00259CBA5C|nr:MULTISPECIES: DUF3482 domain-containing protein [unclassified Methylophaga]|tara:strand:+ start:11175 stop:12578 length:1404 start_codon:yes stop_codon:yes gene_type:complete
MAESTSHPVFAVVGHPNKGKSSIVATLTRQDAVKISEISGTTTSSQTFDLNIEGVTQYTLVDTPGFQRPRQVLSWCQQHAPNAAERRNTIQAFVDEQAAIGSHKFHDEVELLQPILSGAGIIYVVDGSIPYSPEFEAEMTILQWTGQPRMALINPIGGEAYVQEWQDALSQYFSVVRVFNPMTADHQKQFTILSAFAELYEPWRPSIEDTIELLKQYFESLEQQGAFVVAEHIQRMLGHISEIKVPADFVKSRLKDKLKHDYQSSLRHIEASMQRQLQALFAHPEMKMQLQELNADYPDLFDTSHWYIYGLDRQKIVGLSASAGAAAGAVVDVGMGGTSLMTGAFFGGLVSGAASLFATAAPENLKINGIPIAGETLKAGPMKELTFIFVVLGRAVDFLEMILRRTHADRSIAELPETNLTERINHLPKVDQVQLTRLLQKAHKGLSEAELIKLRDWVLVLCLSSEA